MVGVIVLMTIGVVVGTFIGVKEAFYYSDSDKWFLGFLYGMLGGVIAFGMSFLIAMAVDDIADKEVYKKSEEPIYALNDTIGTEGNFFLGSGNIDDEMGYIFLTNGENGKKMKTIDAGDTYINETNNETPRIEYHYIKNKNKNLKKYFFGIFNEKPKHNVIFIPKDSIKYQYNIDLE